MFPDFIAYKNHLRNSYNPLYMSSPRVSLGTVNKFEFLINNQVILMLVAPGPRFGKQNERGRLSSWLLHIHVTGAMRMQADRAGVSTPRGSLAGGEGRDGYLEERIFKQALKDVNSTSSRCR